MPRPGVKLIIKIAIISAIRDSIGKVSIKYFCSSNDLFVLLITSNAAKLIARVI
tara:strand:- start:658 stop:819 length:162 start_codon:yes stop_codon:yes gene_type:complete